MGADLTTLLFAWGRGDQAAFDQLVSLVHEELHRLAHRYMAGQRGGGTLQSTALVNEAFLRLVHCGQVRWQDRTHFFAVSRQPDAPHSRGLCPVAELSKAWRRCSTTRIGRRSRLFAAKEVADLVALDDSLNALAEIDPRKSRVVELKFFGGLTTEEIAGVLGISEPTVLRDWKLAKSWLQREMKRA